MTNPKVSNNKVKLYSILLRKSPLVVIYSTFIKFAPIFIAILGLRLFLGYDLIKPSNSFFILKVLYRTVSFFFVAECCRQYFNSIYIIGSRRLIQIEGFLGVNYYRASIAYQDIRDIQLDQSIWGRLFSHGTLRFGTAATNEYELVFEDVFRVSIVKDLIEYKITEQIFSVIDEIYDEAASLEEEQMVEVNSEDPVDFLRSSNDSNRPSIYRSNK